MGFIKKKCLNKIKSIPGIKFPVTLEVRDKSGKKIIGDAEFHADGKVIALWVYPYQSFDNLSNLRHDLLGSKSGPTYTRFFYRGKSLRDHGVTP